MKLATIAPRKKKPIRSKEVGMSFRIKSIASATSEKPSIARGLFDRTLDYDAGQAVPVVAAVVARFAPVESMHQCAVAPVPPGSGEEMDHAPEAPVDAWQTMFTPVPFTASAAAIACTVVVSHIEPETTAVGQVPETAVATYTPLVS